MTRLVLITLFFTNVCFAQTTTKSTYKISTDNFFGDSINSSPNIEFNDRISLEQIDKSFAQADIRLYTLRSLSNTKTLRRLFLIDKAWAAVEYDEWNNPVKINKSQLSPQPSFDSLLILLIGYNLLTLPNQSDLKSKMRKNVQVNEDGETSESKILVTDGESFTIEISIAGKFRVYQFDNPETYSKFYDNVAELKDYLQIVQTFNEQLRREDNR